ncbi:MAG: helix-turn-helix domain-containing protein [Humibacillus sp.]|nr:helix-turn-helix domain-containing protein [Humibacillus sp.]MDN5779715.1 helix-turn-helix domain-containing protein [Humibacillus sp.]
MTTIPERIGQNIKRLRETQKLTQTDFGKRLAPLIGGEGWTRQAVWKAEEGGRPYTAVELLAIAHVLNVTVPRLFSADQHLELPSGEQIDGAQVEALAGGGSDDRDRWVRLRESTQTFRAAQADLLQFAAGFGVEIDRLELIAAGSPEPHQQGTGSALNDVVDGLGRRRADAWRTRSNRPLRDIEGV